MNRKFRILTLPLAVGAALAAAACNKADDTSRQAPGPTPGTASSVATPGGASPPAGTAAPPPAALPPTPPLPAPAMPSSGPVAASERIFVAEAAANGMAAAEAAKVVMAGQNVNAGVKSFAETLDREHGGANDELKRIATNKGISLPDEVEGDLRTRVNKLKGISGAELARTFLQDFGVDAQKKGVELFERQIREGQDADLRSYAERTLPKLREHLSMAQRMQAGK